MDKNEYRVKLDQINTLVDNQDYESALKIVEQIDWRRVKSARTLCMVGEIYEANQMFERSRELLLMAYDRAPIGKTVLYHLVELAIKMGDLDDAIEYYREFAAASPNDNNKYILKYKIYRARKSPIKDQIAILEEYKAREYTERWSYELARLYAKAGMKEKCIEECDDLILWFAEGRFVTKAMELKMTYTELTPSQKEKYENRFRVNTAVPDFLMPEEPQEMEEAKPVEEKEKHGLEEISADMVASEEEVKEEEEVSVQPEMAVMPEVSRESAEDLQEKAAQGLRDVFAASEEMNAENLQSAIRNASVPQEYVKVPEAKQFVLPEEFKADESAKENRLVAGEIDMSNYDVDIDAIIAETMDDIVAEVNTTAEAGRAINEMLNEEGETKLVKQVDYSELVSDKKTVVEEEEEEPEKELTEEEILQAELAAAVNAMLNGEALVEEVEDVPAEEAVAENEAAEEVAEEVEEAAAETQESPVFSGPEQEHETDDLGITKVFDLEAQIMQALEASEKEAEEVPEEPVEEVKAEPAPTAPERLMRHRLTEEEQKSLFTYFAKIPGMREQLVELLDIVQESACEKTSRNGNVVIVGRPGAGKTFLSECVIKAICKERKMEAAKVAFIDAEDFNEKDPAAVVAKLAGGFLVIERAGEMDPGTIHQLTQAMEFKTNGLILILEDEKQPMKELLRRYPELEEKFDAMITVPVFTNDELVAFAKMYAHELGYHMDELGVLALYTLIGDNQTENEPVTVGQVKEMMDAAIYRSQKGGRKIGRKISNRLTDEMNRTILYEKDFDV